MPEKDNGAPAKKRRRQPTSSKRVERAPVGAPDGPVTPMPDWVRQELEQLGLLRPRREDAAGG